MPFISKITGIITVNQLRERIGGATQDSAEAGYMSDQMLEDIIKQSHDEATEAAAQLIAQTINQGGSPGSPDMYQEMPLDLEPSGNLPNTAFSPIQDGFYPYIKHAVTDQGRTLQNDPGLIKTANTTFFTVYRYLLIGMTLYAIPSTLEACVVHMATEKDLNDFYVGGDNLSKLNDRIVGRAMNMLQARIQEGNRLEALYEPADSQITNNEA